MQSIAFLGAGNIAQAIMGGLIDSEDSYRITTHDPVPDCQEAARSLGVEVAESNRAAIAGADVVMLCVKPNVVLEIADEITPAVTDQLIVSVAAGITTLSLQEHLPGGSHIVRCMPNTPALVRTGMTALFAGPHVTDAEKKTAAALLGAVGETLWVGQESDLDAVTAVSGSGPAYFFLLMESMIEAAILEGLTPPVAKQLVLQTALGSARMAIQSTHDPATLRQQVTSPGGTTQAAVEKLIAEDLPRTVQAAIAAARVRSIELSGTIKTQPPTK